MKNLICAVLIRWASVLVVSPLFLGVVSRVKAVIAGRVGPPLLQPYFDIIKLFRKKCVYSRTATWVFLASGPVVLGCMLALALLVPMGPFEAPAAFAGDILLAAYILAMARFFMISAAMDTGFSMEGMGASREAFFSCLSEPVLFMNFITLALAARSISLSVMVGGDIHALWRLLGPAFLLVVSSFFIVLLAENCRIPVDDPETHLELTMIHEVMILDHSGVDLGFMLYAGAIKLTVFAGILLSMILPVKTGHFIADLGIYAAGVAAIAVLVGVIESIMARLRLNRVRNLLLMAFALAFFGFVVALWRV